MIKAIVLAIFCIGVIATEDVGLNSKDYLGFLQISNNGSGQDNDGMDDGKKVLTVFLMNAIGCVLACAFVQGVIILSKRMNSELLNLRKNYKTFKDFKKFNDFKRNYTIEKETLEGAQGDN